MLWADSDKEFETGNVCFVCIQKERERERRISQPGLEENVYFRVKRKGGKWALKCQSITCTMSDNLGAGVVLY